MKEIKTNIKMEVTPEQSKTILKIIKSTIDFDQIPDFNHYIFIRDYNDVTWSGIEYGEKHRFEEVETDLFIRTNGTCEEEPHAELKRKYKSGDYTLCLKEKRDNLYEIAKLNTIPIWSKVFDYKLIHRRHKEVLEHCLNGGKAEVSVFGELWMNVTDFIDSYDEEKEYRIKQDQPQTRTFVTKKELAKALMRGEKWKQDNRICYFNEPAEYNPFRVNDNINMDIEWDYCDGKTLWTRVNN